jgi:serine/threonine-protein kinase
MMLLREAAMPELIQTIGRYVIDRVLGQGAMGVVFLAQDPLLKRRVAIKMIRAEGQERAQAMTLFRGEAEISAQLNHPNIVTVYDVGEEPGLGPFIAMEFVEGHSLGHYVREGTLDLETRFGILVQTMRALRAAHRHAIVHRDVKPENILVGLDGRVKLMDFGIAKTMAPRPGQPGGFLGSPAYSAPELLRGSAPSPSSDRYAFAVTAFELLSGQLPHPGNSVTEVVTHVLKEPPAIPPDMAPETARLFREALARNPDDRPGTLMEFLMPLVAAQPMDPAARERINAMFRQDDYAGDILPLRLRAAAGPARVERAGPLPPLPTSSPVPPPKIELELKRAPRRAPVRPRRRPGRGDEGVSRIALTLVKWFLAVLVSGQVFWWIYRYLQTHQAPKP